MIVLIELGLVSSGIVSGIMVMLVLVLVLFFFLGVVLVWLVCVLSMFSVIMIMMILLLIWSELIENLKKLMICLLSNVDRLIMIVIEIDVILMVWCFFLFVWFLVRLMKNGIVLIGLIRVSSEKKFFVRFIGLVVGLGVG